VSATAEAWLDDIIAHPKDDAPRLMFADWLDEHGDEARAEFIRVQCGLAQLYPAGSIPELWDDGRNAARDALRRRERGLLDEHGFDWFGQLVRIARLDGGRGPDRNAWHFRSLGGTLGWCLFRRGFVAEIALTLADWYGGPCPCWGHGTDGRPRPAFACPACRGTGHTPGHGPALVSAAPLERVTLSDREPWQPPGGWYGWVPADQPPFNAGTHSHLPRALFGFLPDPDVILTSARGYHSLTAALDAASHVLLAWANAEADRAAR
jgi:uncharacterized protein (TIGR02996 family)